jgi:hypothetical protein
MTIEKRVSDLEEAIAPPPEGRVRVRVIRVPAESEVPREEQDAWIAAHPQSVSKIVEIRPGEGPEVVYIMPDNGRG